MINLLEVMGSIEKKLGPAIDRLIQATEDHTRALNRHSAALETYLNNVSTNESDS